MGDVDQFRLKNPENDRTEHQKHPKTDAFQGHMRTSQQVLSLQEPQSDAAPVPIISQVGSPCQYILAVSSTSSTWQLFLPTPSAVFGTNLYQCHHHAKH